MFHLPGEVVTGQLNNQLSSSSSSSSTSNVILGVGLVPLGQEDVQVVIPGRLMSTTGHKVQILSKTRQYCFPSVGDVVLGVVSERFSETVNVDIGAPQLATLSLYEFEGATKRNKPDLKIGDVVMARVTLAYKEMEPELTCVPLVRHSLDESLGKLSLPNACLLQVSLPFVHYLMLKKCPFLDAAKERLEMAFELLIGKNCRIYISSKTAAFSIKLARIFELADALISTNLTLDLKQLPFT